MFQDWRSCYQHLDAFGGKCIEPLCPSFGVRWPGSWVSGHTISTLTRFPGAADLDMDRPRLASSHQGTCQSRSWTVRSAWRSWAQGWSSIGACLWEIRRCTGQAYRRSNLACESWKSKPENRIEVEISILTLGLSACIARYEVVLHSLFFYIPSFPIFCLSDCI